MDNHTTSYLPEWFINDINTIRESGTEAIPWDLIHKHYMAREESNDERNRIWHTIIIGFIEAFNTLGTSVHQIASQVSKFLDIQTTGASEGKQTGFPSIPELKDFTHWLTSRYEHRETVNSNDALACSMLGIYVLDNNTTYEYRIPYNISIIMNIMDILLSRNQIEIWLVVAEYILFSPYYSNTSEINEIQNVYMQLEGTGRAIYVELKARIFATRAISCDYRDNNEEAYSIFGKIKNEIEEIKIENKNQSFVNLLKLMVWHDLAFREILLNKHDRAIRSLIKAYTIGNTNTSLNPWLSNELYGWRSEMLAVYQDLRYLLLHHGDGLGSAEYRFAQRQFSYLYNENASIYRKGTIFINESAQAIISEEYDKAITKAWQAYKVYSQLSTYIGKKSASKAVARSLYAKAVHIIKNDIQGIGASKILVDSAIHATFSGDTNTIDKVCCELQSQDKSRVTEEIDRLIEFVNDQNIECKYYLASVTRLAKAILPLVKTEQLELLRKRMRYLSTLTLSINTDLDIARPSIRALGQIGEYSLAVAKPEEILLLILNDMLEAIKIHEENPYIVIQVSETIRDFRNLPCFLLHNPEIMNKILDICDIYSSKAGQIHDRAWLNIIGIVVNFLDTRELEIGKRIKGRLEDIIPKITKKLYDFESRESRIEEDAVIPRIVLNLEIHCEHLKKYAENRIGDIEKEYINQHRRVSFPGRFCELSASAIYFNNTLSKNILTMLLQISKNANIYPTLRSEALEALDFYIRQSTNRITVPIMSAIPDLVSELSELAFSVLAEKDPSDSGPFDLGSVKSIAVMCITILLKLNRMLELEDATGNLNEEITKLYERICNKAEALSNNMYYKVSQIVGAYLLGCGMLNGAVQDEVMQATLSSLFEPSSTNEKIGILKSFGNGLTYANTMYDINNPIIITSIGLTRVSNVEIQTGAIRVLLAFLHITDKGKLTELVQETVNNFVEQSLGRKVMILQEKERINTMNVGYKR